MSFLFIDLEMTGLDPVNDHILEIAAIVTDFDLNEKDLYSSIVHQSDTVLNNMSKWCHDHFDGPNRLTEQSRRSTVSIIEVEQELLQLLEKYEKPFYLCGNSVHMDKFFLMQHMPTLTTILHYRIIDISTIKILTEKWTTIQPIKKSYQHRAMEDIRESIEELRMYKETLFSK